MKGRELALKYLALRARTVWELRKHLIEKDQPLEDIEFIIDALIKAGYLNDEKYAVDYIYYGRSKDRGQIRINKELANKGISEETLEDALETVQTQDVIDNNGFSEREQAKKLSVKWARGKEIEEKLLGKIARKLEALGYDSETIYGAVGTLMVMESGQDERD